MIRSKDLNVEIKKLELIAEKSTDDRAVNRAMVKGIAWRRGQRGRDYKATYNQSQADVV